MLAVAGLGCKYRATYFLRLPLCNPSSKSLLENFVHRSRGDEYAEGIPQRNFHLPKTSFHINVADLRLETGVRREFASTGFRLFLGNQDNGDEYIESKPFVHALLVAKGARKYDTFVNLDAKYREKAKELRIRLSGPSSSVMKTST